MSNTNICKIVKNTPVQIAQKWFKMFRQKIRGEYKTKSFSNKKPPRKRSILKNTSDSQYNSTNDIDINTTMNANIGIIENSNEYVERLKEKNAVINLIEVGSIIQFDSDPKYLNYTAYVLHVDQHVKTVHLLNSDITVSISTRELMENENWYIATIVESPDKHENSCNCRCS